VITHSLALEFLLEKAGGRFGRKVDRGLPLRLIQGVKRQILKLIDKHRLEPRTICEVGCGAAEVLDRLQSRLPVDAEFCGCEISPQALRLADQSK